MRRSSLRAAKFTSIHVHNFPDNSRGKWALPEGHLSEATDDLGGGIPLPRSQFRHPFQRTLFTLHSILKAAHERH